MTKHETKKTPLGMVLCKHSKKMTLFLTSKPFTIILHKRKRNLDCFPIYLAKVLFNVFKKTPLLKA